MEYTLIRSADWVARKSDKTKGLRDDDDISNPTEIAASIHSQCSLCVYSKLYHNLYKYCARTPSFLPLPTESTDQYPMKRADKTKQMTMKKAGKCWLAAAVHVRNQRHLQSPIDVSPDPEWKRSTLDGSAQSLQRTDFIGRRRIRNIATTLLRLPLSIFVFNAK